MERNGAISALSSAVDSSAVPQIPKGGKTVFGMLVVICGLKYYNTTHESPVDGKSDSMLLEEHASLEDQVKALREKTLAEAERQRQARKKGLE